MSDEPLDPFGESEFYLRDITRLDEIPEMFRTAVTVRLVGGQMLIGTVDQQVATLLINIGIETICELLKWMALHMTEEHGIETSASDLWTMLMLKLASEEPQEGDT